MTGAREAVMVDWVRGGDGARLRALRLAALRSDRTVHKIVIECWQG